MKIEHIICLSSEEYDEFLRKSGAHSRQELKNYLKESTGIQTDFCVKIISDNWEIIPIDYGDNKE